MKTSHSKKERLVDDDKTYTFEDIYNMIEKTNLESIEEANQTIEITKTFFRLQSLSESVIQETFLESAYAKISSPSLLVSRFGFALLRNMIAQHNMIITNEIAESVVSHIANYIQKPDAFIIMNILAVFDKIASESRELATGIMNIVSITNLYEVIMSNTQIDLLVSALQLMRSYSSQIGICLSQTDLNIIFQCANELLQKIIPDPNAHQFDEQFKPIIENVASLLVTTYKKNEVLDTLWVAPECRLTQYVNNCFLYISHTGIKISGLKLIQRLNENILNREPLNYEKVISLITHKVHQIQMEAIKCLLTVDYIYSERLFNGTNLVPQLMDIIVNGPFDAKVCSINLIETKKDYIDFVNFYNPEIFSSLISILLESSKRTKKQVCQILTRVQRKLIELGRADEMREALIEAGAEDALLTISEGDYQAAENALEILHFITND